MAVAVLMLLGISFPEVVVSLLHMKLTTTSARDLSPSTKCVSLKKCIFDDEDAASTTAGTCSDLSDSESDNELEPVGCQIPIQMLLRHRPAPTPPPLGSLQAKPIPACNHPSPVKANAKKGSSMKLTGTPVESL